MTIVLNGSNVNDLYAQAIFKIKEDGVKTPSRAGEVLVLPQPVVSVTTDPTQRVLTDPGRDANPFFHFFESLWMLSGSNDAKWLDRFVSDFSSRFAEPGGRQWGAYGFRWRHHFGFDQINDIVSKLKADPFDRRIVLSMWDPQADVYDRPNGVRDLPCNTHIYFRMIPLKGVDRKGEFVLDMTVTCRSNDIIWGAYGANAVHFSFLLEYVAGRVDAIPGTMHQFSNNWHAYTDTLKKVGDPTCENLYAIGKIKSMAIGSVWDWWDSDLALFMWNPGHPHEYKNKWFVDVAEPMWQVNELWKAGCKQEALEFCRGIRATDWRHAATQWITRRM